MGNRQSYLRSNKKTETTINMIDPNRKGGVALVFESAGLTQIGDIQLWLIPAEWSGKAISIPVYAAECAGIGVPNKWAVWPALRLSDPLKRMIGKHMKRFGADELDARWIASGESFPFGMSKANGVTPSYYLSHDSLATGEIATPEPFSDEFAREVFNASGIADYAIFKAVWAALIGAIPRWLMRELKPINFGYMKLYCVPMRYNWKLNLLAAFPTLRTVIAHVGRRKWKMIIPQLRDAMFNTRQVELHDGEKHPYFGWTLEVVPTKQFTDFATAVETTRSQAYPGEAYVRQWGAIIARLQPQLEEILFYACKKTSYASASVRQHGQEGDPGFRPLLAPGTMRKEAVDRDDLPIVCNPPGTFVTSEESGEPIEVKSFKHMPTVSFVRRKR